MLRRGVEQLRTFKPYHHIPRRFRIHSSPGNDRGKHREKDSFFLLYIWKARRRESRPSSNAASDIQQPTDDNQKRRSPNHAATNNISGTNRTGPISLIPSNRYHISFGKLFYQGLAGVEQLCRLPSGVNYHEWITSNECSFFANINLVYHGVREFCTNKNCPNLSGYDNRQLSYWMDDKGRKIKCAAQQHMDLALDYVDRILSAKNESDEDIVQENQQQYSLIGSSLRRADSSISNGIPYVDSYRNLPITKPDVLRRVVRCLLKVLCHLYHAHFDKIVQLKLHQHINSDGELLNGLFHALLRQATKEVIQQCQQSNDENVSVPNSCTTNLVK
ncbi:hypothetical protein GJ496_002256 [Pomphorhynchus laevis]|nr:hypothetical protein GJ496_002256 [Pomphorhynchus laevis]